MNTTRIKRRLRVVADCPRPESSPHKPIQYGFAGGHKITQLAPMPTAQEITIRARAQSLLSKDGKRAELPTYEEALAIIAKSER